MSYTASPRVRRVRFAGLSTQSSNSAPLDGAIDTPNHPDLSPRRCEAVWTDLKKKTSWKDFVPKVEYPGWPAAAFKPPPFLQWLKYFLITLVIGTIFSGVALALFL